jgi:PEP-CTERM motif
MIVSKRMSRWLAIVVAVAWSSAEVARGQSAVPESKLETFLGLEQGALTGLNNGPVMNGSAIEQTIMVTQPGATLSFTYAFMTNEPPASGLSAINPFAFITAPTLTDFADTFSPLAASSSAMPFARSTGNMVFSETFSAPGTYTLGIGVANVTDNMYSSALLLDNFKLSGGSIANGSFETGNFASWATIGNDSVIKSFYGNGPPDGNFQALVSTGSVPEPSSLVLLLLGGVGAGSLVALRSRMARAQT